jgi:exodeoxyribonuclease V gamma subunit
MLHVYHSNRLEVLADRLAAVVQTPLPNALASEIVVVHSSGMGRWVALELARRSGICANLTTPFPAEFVWYAMRGVLGDLPSTSPFDPEVLSWRVMAWLVDLDDDAAYAPLRHYLADGDETKRYQLARRIAATLDQYLVYRPDWIRRWEAGEEGHWQARLWRALTRTSGAHWVRLLDRMNEALAGGRLASGSLPARVSLFALPALSPGYLDVISGLARAIDVHVYLLNPCREHWGEIVAEREIGRRAGDRAPDSLYLESGNGLLASLGGHARDFLDMVQELPAAAVDEAYVDPGEGALLHALQHDVLTLSQRGADGARTPLAPGDDSLQVHVCHGAMREVEVLHDRLLDLFERYPALRPSDVVVMTPDIDAYAPYIDAVFGTSAGSRRIPYTISGRGTNAQSALVETFLALLALPDSRFDANLVLALLECPAVQRRFELTEADLELAHDWVRETAIRWAIDGAERAELGLPATDEHTWRAGLNRLLLGYALPGGDARQYAGLLPYDDVEGASAQALGRLAAFLEAVFELRALKERRLSIKEWAVHAGRLLDRFMAPDEEDEEGARGLRAALETIADAAGAAGYARPIGLDLLRACLRQSLSSPGGRLRGLAGSVNFASLAPLRAIPFAVVCLIGMNDGAFPHPDRPLSFDLMAQARRRGDRSRRDEDRYLFLEALLSARRVLYVSYVGRSIRDNGVIPPSVLVSELTEYVRQGWSDGAAGDPLAVLVTEHPLQAFSPRYFESGERLFSYAAELCAASAALKSAAEPAPFLPDVLPEAEAEWRQVELSDLIRFYAQPARFLLRQRLGIQLEEGEGLIETREPFLLEGLSAWQLRRRLLDLDLAGAAGPAALELLRARGDLPHGGLGDALVALEQARVAPHAARVREHLPAAPLEPLWVDLSFGDLRLTGWLRGVSAAGLFGYGPGDDIKARDRLSLWIRHLVLNALAPAGVACRSLFLARGEAFALRPAAEAHALLGELLNGYWNGLHRPLHFFPRTSHAYVTAERGDPLARARREWQGTDFGNEGECEEAYYRLAFRGADPLDGEFTRLAKAVYGPMRAHEEES